MYVTYIRKEFSLLPVSKSRATLDRFFITLLLRSGIIKFLGVSQLLQIENRKSSKKVVVQIITIHYSLE